MRGFDISSLPVETPEETKALNEKFRKEREAREKSFDTKPISVSQRFSSLPIETPEETKARNLSSQKIKIKDKALLRNRFQKDTGRDFTKIPEMTPFDKLKQIEPNQLFESAKKEVIAAKDAVKLIPSLFNKAKPGMLNLAMAMKYGTDKQKQQAIEDVKSGTINLRNLLKQSVIDTGKTFGIDLESPDNKLDLDRAIEKWESAPIESVLDATMLGGAAKSLGTSILKSTRNIVPMINKKTAKKIISKNDLETKQIAKTVADKDVKTMLDDLYEEAPIIKKLNISRQLDNPNYLVKVSDDLAKKIRVFNKIDSQKLKQSLKGVKDRPVSKTLLREDMREALDKKNFLVKKNPDDEFRTLLDVDNIDKGLNKKNFIDELIHLNKDQSMTVGEIKKRMDNLDDKINWKDKKVSDEGLIEMRRVYRNELRKASPEYDAIANSISEKLDLFEPQLKRIEKLGSGEKLGKSIFQSKEEMEEFIEFMGRSKSSLAGPIRGDLMVIKAWHSWNKYFKQNPDFLIGSVPGASSKLIPGIKKRIIKGDIATNKKIRPKSVLGRKQLLTSRAILEARDMNEDINN